MSENRPSTRRRLLWLMLSALLSAAGVYLLWRAHPDPDYWKQRLDDARSFLEAHPLALILVIATLPGIGFPISPLLILAGIVLGPQFGLPLTCLIAIAAQTFCSSWTFWLAAGPLRGWLKKHVLRDRKLPELEGGNALRLGFIMRMTPGIPYALQNVVLGVAGLRFKTYLLVSVPLMSLYTIGFIVTGGAIFEGKAGLALTGALLLVVVVLATRMLLKRNKTADV